MHNGIISSIMSQGPLITWSCKVTGKIRSVTSLLLHVLWPPNLAMWWLTMRSHTTHWTSSHVRSSDELKTYLHYHHAYGHQTWQGGWLRTMRLQRLWEALRGLRTKTLRVKFTLQPFKRMVYDKSRTFCLHHLKPPELAAISFITISVVTKFVGMVTYCKKNQPLKSHEPLITWSCDFDLLSYRL